MKPEMTAIWIVFGSLLIWTVAAPRVRSAALQRTLPEWALDFAGLSIHGTLVPLFETLVIFVALSRFLPQWKGVLALPGVVSFFLGFVVVDYLYYWNHRLLHSRRVWRLHSVHHSGETFDVFTTSRNSAFTTFFILYVWVNGIALYLLADPAPYAWSVAISNCLDLIRHARLGYWPSVFPFNLLISPAEHGWHHSRDKYGVNFGANLNLWDRLHGTYHPSTVLPEKFGAPLQESSVWNAFWRGSP